MLLANAQQLVSFNRPTFRDYKSVETYMHKKKPLIEKEASFIYKKEDFITLRPGRENAWLDTFVEKLLQILHSRLKLKFIQVDILHSFV